ncbi:MAG: response regulator transcription factor [Ruminococcaceae bacterium]|nr:response regulator transcription factor [Oscillospiraceae bacterium]
MRILIAEDERDLNLIIKKKLQNSGYTVDSVFDGEEALDFIAAADYDGIILDIMMPIHDGFYVLSELRKAGKKTPVLFLTARDSVEDRVKGLDSGANDYLIKPFSFDELMARLRAMTRPAFGLSDNILSIDNLTVNCTSHEVKRGEKLIALSAKEYTLLTYMLKNKGRVLSREQLENHVWSFDYEGGSNIVEVYIRYLRKKIDDGFDKKLIHTIRGLGYVIRENP